MSSEILPVNAMNAELAAYLSTFITPERYSRFLTNLNQRTRYLTVVLEDIYQPHNASAVLRTADCFGIQDVHVIENRNKYEVNPDVELGASRWLSLHRYSERDNNTADCLASLKGKGYRIYATSPHTDDVTPETLPLDHKIALVFGTELNGLSPEALGMAEGHVKIPMFGFTESLNISVSAAIFIQTLTRRIRDSKVSWQLTQTESGEILLQWLRTSVKKSDLLIEAYLKKKQSP
jgi:tRNA (guanosine-2'-O-)-methyltransferase